MNIKEKLSQLPTSWHEITLEQYKRLYTAELYTHEDIDAVQKLENVVTFLSALMDIPETEIEDLPVSELNKLADKVAFINEVVPVGTKTNIKWKEGSEITFNEFIYFQSFKDEAQQTLNLEKIIKTFSHTKLTEEEILRLPITDILQGTLELKKKLQAGMKHSIRYQKLAILKHLLKRRTSRKLLATKK